MLEPELPIVDAHHHLWDMRGTRQIVPVGSVVYKLPVLCWAPSGPQRRGDHLLFLVVFGMFRQYAVFLFSP